MHYQFIPTKQGERFGDPFQLSLAKFCCVSKHEFSEYYIWSLKFKVCVAVQIYFKETEFLNCWSIFRLVVIFQLDMGDLLVELELGASGRGGSSLKRWRQFEFKLRLCFSNDWQRFIIIANMIKLCLKLVLIIRAGHEELVIRLLHLVVSWKGWTMCPSGRLLGTASLAGGTKCLY